MLFVYNFWCKSHRVYCLHLKISPVTPAFFNFSYNKIVCSSYLKLSSSIRLSLLLCLFHFEFALARYMSVSLLRTAREHNLVVAVVGKGHLSGIQKYWKQPVDVRILYLFFMLQIILGYLKVIALIVQLSIKHSTSVS